MKAPKTPIPLFEGSCEQLLIIDDGDEWCAVTEAFHRHYPDRAAGPFGLANYSRAEIDAVMVEFEPRKSPACNAVSPTNSD